MIEEPSSKRPQTSPVKRPITPTVLHSTSNFVSLSSAEVQRLSEMKNTLNDAQFWQQKVVRLEEQVSVYNDSLVR
jgi:hypothetical protein